MNIFVCWIAFALLVLSLPVHANVTYESLADAVERAQAQAYIYLKKGVYDTKTGDVSVKWTIPNDIRATVRFRYGASTIQEGLIDFGTTPTFAVFKSQAGLCTRFEIKKVIVLVGGAIAPESDIYMRPDASCKQKHSAFQNSVEQVFSLQPEARKLFRGMPFSSLQRICKAGTPKCYDAKEPPPTAAPISRIVLFTTTDQNGNPTNDAFSVGLKAKQRIELPNGAGYVRMGADSGIVIQYAAYDVSQKLGSGIMKFFRVNVDEGQLLFGKTMLSLSKGSALSFDNISIEAQGETRITDGTFEGRLGDGSIIRLTADEGKDSSVTLQSAAVTLNGLNLEFTKLKSRLSGSSGMFEIIAKASRLHLADNVLLLVEGTSLKLALTCEAAAPPQCRPFAWSSDGETNIKAQLFPAQLILSQGGYIGFPQQNKLSIAGGQLLTDTLYVNTEDKKAPITGTFQKLDLRLEAQDWIIDKNMKIRAAQFSLLAQNMKVVRDDPFPVGEVAVEASVSDLEVQGIGPMQFASGSSKMVFKLARLEKDDVRIVDGTLTAAIQARAAPESAAKVSLRIFDLRYYKEFGTAKLDFGIDSMAAVYRTPQDQKSEGVPGGKFELRSYSLPLAFTLLSPVGFKALELKVDNGNWTVPTVANIPVGIRLDVPGAKAAQAQHYLGGGDIGGGNYAETSCRPEVKTQGKSYVISGRIDLLFADTPRKFVSKDYSINEPIGFDVDASDCSTVAFISCGIVGGILSGGNVLMAGVAGLACGRKVDEEKKKLENTLRDKSFEYVGKLNFDIVTR